MSNIQFESVADPPRTHRRSADRARQVPDVVFSVGAIAVLLLVWYLGSQWNLINPSYFPTPATQDLGLFEKVGLKPKFFTFQSGAPLLAALKSESLDVVTAGLGLAFALGQNIPLKILYWTSNDAAGEGLVVDAKSEIKSYLDITKAHKNG